MGGAAFRETAVAISCGKGTGPEKYRPLDLAADLSEQKNVDHVIRFYLLGTHDAIESGGVTKKEV